VCYQGDIQTRHGHAIPRPDIDMRERDREREDERVREREREIAREGPVSLSC